MAKTIMVQGTSSHVGKSILCTALCRIFAQDGYSTAPFKAQNMALNSAVTPDGGEIGRAQGVQAEAAGIKPTVFMNPILLKPKQDMQSQVVVLGKPLGDMSAREYQNEYVPKAESLVKECITRLKSEYEVLVIEGAGSPAEVNLRDRDIVNMKTAELAEAPVLLAADIDRGGALAALIGTLELLEPDEKERIKGFIINKFRGDIELLRPGLDFLERKTGLPVLGVVPYLYDHGIDEEDSVCLTEINSRGDVDQAIQIAVVHLPQMSNFTDFNPLMNLPDTRFRYVNRGQNIGSADIIIIPGTKNTILDLNYLREQGYDQEIISLAERGAYVVGICGGYQMLGQELLDPLGTEAGIGGQKGLGLLPGITTYYAEKETHQIRATILSGNGFWEELHGKTVTGYEIHMGSTVIEPAGRDLLQIDVRSGRKVKIGDGATNSSGKVWGTHIHGLFDNPSLLLAFINNVRQEKGLARLEYDNLDICTRERNYDRLADTVREALDMPRIYQIMNLKSV